MTEQRRKLLLSIHSNLHSGASNVWIEGKPYNVQTNSSQTSSLKYEDKVFIKQNSTSSGVFGRLVKAGHQVTLITRTGKKWGAIVDQEIWDPEDGE